MAKGGVAVRTRDRRVNLIASSPEIRAMHAERRYGIPVLLPSEVELGPEIIISVEDLANLNIDETYQRGEITDEVNELSHVLSQGGIIPDPVSVAVRQYGDEPGARYIVDGQQRFWAHLDCKRPLLAKLYYVKSREAELKLFDTLNNSVALTSAVRIQAWPGPVATILKELDESPRSAIRGRIGWKGNVKANYHVGTLLKGVMAAISGHTRLSGTIRSRLQAFDAHFQKSPRFARRAAFEFAKLLAAVFPDLHASEVKGPIAAAFGRTAHIRWRGLYEGENQVWPHPSDAQITQLRRIDFPSLMPSSHERWTTPIQEAIEQVWPLPKNLNKGF